MSQDCNERVWLADEAAAFPPEQDSFAERVVRARHNLDLGGGNDMASSSSPLSSSVLEAIAVGLVGETATCLQECVGALVEDALSPSQRPLVLAPARRHQLLLCLRRWARDALRRKVETQPLVASSAVENLKTTAIVLDERLLDWFVNELVVRHPATNGLSVVSWSLDPSGVGVWHVLVEALRCWLQSQAGLVVLLETPADSPTEQRDQFHALRCWRDWWRNRALPMLWRRVAESCLQFLSWFRPGYVQVSSDGASAWSEEPSVQHSMIVVTYVSLMERLLFVLIEAFPWTQADLFDTDDDLEASLESEQSIHLSPGAWSEVLTLYSAPLAEGLLTLFAFAAERASAESSCLNLALTTMQVVRVLSRLHRSCWVSAIDADRFRAVLLRILFRCVQASADIEVLTFYSVTRELVLVDVLRRLMWSHGTVAVACTLAEAGHTNASVNDVWSFVLQRGLAWLESPKLIEAVVDADLLEADPAQERIACLADAFLELWDGAVWHRHRDWEMRPPLDECSASQVGRPPGHEPSSSSSPTSFHDDRFFMERSRLLVERLLVNFLPRYALTWIERHGLTSIRSVDDSRCRARLAVIASLVRFVTRPCIVTAPGDESAPASSSEPHGLLVLEDLTKQSLAQWRIEANPNGAASGALLFLLLSLLGELVGDEDQSDDGVPADLDPSATSTPSVAQPANGARWYAWLEAVLLPPMRTLAAVAETRLAAIAHREESHETASMITAALLRTATRWSAVLGPGSNPATAACRLSSRWMLSAPDAAHLSALLVQNRPDTFPGFDLPSQTAWRMLWFGEIHRALFTQDTLVSAGGAPTPVAFAALALLRRLARSWPAREHLSAETVWWQQLAETCLQLENGCWRNRQHRWCPALVRGLGECLGWAATTLMALDEVDVPGLGSLWTALLHLWMQWVGGHVQLRPQGDPGANAPECHPETRATPAPAAAFDADALGRACYILDLLRGLTRVLQKTQAPDAVEPLEIIDVSQRALSSFVAYFQHRSSLPRNVLNWLADLAGARILPLPSLVTALVDPVWRAVAECWHAATNEAALGLHVRGGDVGTRLDEATSNAVVWLKTWRALIQRSQELELTRTNCTSSSSPQALPSWFVCVWQNGLGLFLRMVARDHSELQVLLVPRVQEELAHALADAAWLRVPYCSCLSSGDKEHLRNVLYALMVHAHSSLVVRSVADTISGLWASVWPIELRSDANRELDVAPAASLVEVRPPDRDLSLAPDAWLAFIGPVVQRLLIATEGSAEYEALVTALFQLLRGTQSTDQILVEQFAQLPWSEIRATISGPWIWNESDDERCAEAAPSAAPSCCLAASRALCATAASEPAVSFYRGVQRTSFRQVVSYWIRAIRIQMLYNVAIES